MASRVVMAPVIAWCLIERCATMAGWIYIAAVLSDIYDGVIARKLGVVTLRLRLADGCADIWLFVCLFAGLWVSCRDLLGPLVWPFATGMTLQGMSWTYCWWRFGKMTSYHSMLAKLTSLALLAGILSMLFGAVSWPLALALWIFVASLLEEIAMTAVSKHYHHDVWNLAAAWRLRKGDA